MHGFDRNYFVQQVAGLSQLAGELMLVKPAVIDLGWGKLKSAIVGLPDSAFVKVDSAKEQRRRLVDSYVASFRQVESGAQGEARAALKTLSSEISTCVGGEQQASLRALVDSQAAKLA